MQHLGGAYSLAAAPKDHEVRASLRGFQEGDNLRVLRPKDEKEGARETCCEISGYALKLTWDVPVCKTQGILEVNACWHDMVFRNECGFAESNFLF